MIVGTKLTEKGKNGTTYVVVGEDGGGYVIAEAERHGSPERVTAADLAARFGVEIEAPAAVDEISAWRQLGESFAAKVERANRREFGPRPVSPEETFTRISDADAARLGHKPR